MATEELVNLFPKFNSNDWNFEAEDEAYFQDTEDYDAEVYFETTSYSIYTKALYTLRGETVNIGVESISSGIYIELGDYRIDNSNKEINITIGADENLIMYIKSNIISNEGIIEGAYLYIVDNSSGEPEEPDYNELIQGGINDETGSFEDETANVVKTNFIDISDKKQIMVQVLTENVYIAKCYLYNANKELVKILDISVDKKHMFGIDLQKLIEEVINDGDE